MLWKAFRPAKVAFSYSNLQCRLGKAISSSQTGRGGATPTTSGRGPASSIAIASPTAADARVVARAERYPNQQCAVARRPRPGVNRTRSRLQERPKGAGTRPGGRRHDPHRGILDPPQHPQMGRMRILSAGRMDLGRREWEMDESVVNSSKVGGSGITTQAEPPPPV